MFQYFFHCFATLHMVFSGFLIPWAGLPYELDKSVIKEEEKYDGYSVVSTKLDDRKDQQILNRL